ncbi:DHA2 family efflux MFS transporter permease subunit [Streptomyces sp. NPDC101733]|uniref:MFS transporter n=1 Tax=unclassified Streptomyces TaxID=2593676 RepID=UPI0037FCD4D4
MGRRHRWWVLGVMTSASSMIAIDALVVLVALPTIQRNLDVSTTGLQWVINAYLLGFAGMSVLGGRIGDIMGHERTFRLGTLLFVVASIAAGLAQSEAWLIAARAAQGAGAAILRPSSQVLIFKEFGSRERGQAMGISSGLSTLFYGTAPLIGGLLTTAFSWRAIFFVNPPVGIAAVVLARLLLTDERPRREPVDWASAPLLIGGLVCLVLSLTQARYWGWSSATVVALLATGAALMAVLVLRERRIAHPLIHFELFTHKEFAVGTAVISTVRFAFVGFAVFGVIWLQDVVGMSPFEAGVAVLPLTLPTVVFAPLGGRLCDRLGPRVPLGVGTGLCVGALLCAAAALHRQHYAWLLASYCAMGIGMGLCVSPAWTTLLNGASTRMRGYAAGVTQTAREVSAALGLAVMGAIVAHVQGFRLKRLLHEDGRLPSERFDQVERSIGKAVAATQDGSPLPLGIPSDLLPGLKSAVTAAVSAAFYAGAAALLAAALAVALLPGKEEFAEAGRGPGDDPE